MKFNYSEELAKQWVEEICNISKRRTSLSCIIPYSEVSSFNPRDEDRVLDILEYIFNDDVINDDIQSIDFDDVHQRIVVTHYMPPSEEKIEEEKEMTYKEQIRKAVQEFYDVTKAFATSRHYTISYWWVESNFGLDLNDKQVRDDVHEMSYSNEFCDLIQTLDFDDDKKEVLIMIWESNNRKKYTLNNYEEFCKNALVCPPIEGFEDGSIDEDKWYKEHNIHIITGNHDIELEYHADNVNEIEYALREMYEVENDIRYATTGNTTGSEYRDATWKDILRLNIMRIVYEGKSMKEAIHYTIYNFDTMSYANCMKEINNQTSYNDEFEVNFFKIASDDMDKLFEGSARRRAIKEMLGKEIRLSEMIDKDGAHDDKTVITDYSIHPAGHLVGWHYGVDWDMNSSVNQQYINDYIKEMIGND